MDLIPIPMTMISQQPNPQMVQMQQQLQLEAAPVRIRFALDFLIHLTMKTSPYVMRTNQGLESHSGQQLTHAELNAQASACHTLNDYFLGKYKEIKPRAKTICPTCGK